MESRSQRLSLDELHLLRWLLGGLLILLSIATVFYLDIGSEAMAAAAAAGVLFALVRPASPARIPVLAHRLAFPAIAAFFVSDLWYTGQLLPAIVRLDLLLLLYRGVSHRARRDDMQIVVLGLFLIVVAGVLTVSLVFAGQILLFTACALGLMMVVTIAAAAEGGQAPMLAPRGVVPPWAEDVSWRRLFWRLREVSDWRLLASAVGLFLGVVAVSGLLFLAIPRFQLENSLFLERFVVKRAMTGFNDSIKFGDITEITQDDSIAFDVDLSDPSQAPAIPYWRMVVLDEYRNGGFKLSSSLRGEFNPERTLANLYPKRGGPPGAPTWTFYVESGVSRYLPILGNFWALRFREAQNLRYSPDLAIVALRDEPASMTAYRIEGMAADSPELVDRAFATRWAKRGQVGSLQVGLPELSAADRASLDRMRSELGPVRGLGAAAFAGRAVDWLRRNHGYSLSPHIPGGQGDPLVRWMASRESGHCELFAGALVLMARSDGIPARVVTGFKGGTWNAYSGNFTVRNSDAHAWTELWDEKKSAWVREDPLATAGAVDEAKEKGAAALATLMDRSWSARLSSLRVFWYRRIVNFDQQSQAETLKAVKDSADNSGKWLRNAVAGAARRLVAWIRAPWDGARLARLAALLAGAGAVGWMFATGRWRLVSVGRARGVDPVRREAGRWLRRLDGPDGLVADLQRLRYGPAPTWPRPSEVFRRARRAASGSRRRPRASSRNTS
jgi:transglutaminase-like putative cysteine protease